MNTQTKVAILFGGQSAEHEVSIKSARNVLNAIDKHKYKVVLISIDKKGQWHTPKKSRLLIKQPSIEGATKSDDLVCFVPGGKGRYVVYEDGKVSFGKVDVVFPILHGPMGEDGTVQGLLEVAGVAYVGAGVAGSVLGMDKDIMKRILQKSDIPMVDYLTIHQSERKNLSFEKIVKKLGLPLFVKPASLGSSVGISKVDRKDLWGAAIDLAFSFGDKIIIEQGIENVREIECSVLGNDTPKVSCLGEIKVSKGFYSYDTKYNDPDNAKLSIPAEVDPKTTQKIESIALKVFWLLECRGFARVDFFLTKEGEVFFNEINTIPGFTNISMYPKLWEYQGLKYGDLIGQLIDLA
jgi:D-alanine-D-alanine ligase